MGLLKVLRSKLRSKLHIPDTLPHVEWDNTIEVDFLDITSNNPLVRPPDDPNTNTNAPHNGPQNEHDFYFEGCLHRANQSVKLPHVSIKVRVVRKPYFIIQPQYCLECCSRRAIWEHRQCTSFYDRHRYMQLDPSDKRLIELKRQRNQDVRLCWVDFMLNWGAFEMQQRSGNWSAVAIKLDKDEEGLITTIRTYQKQLWLSEGWVQRLEHDIDDRSWNLLALG
jgi:hypothetical protein